MNRYLVLLILLINLVGCNQKEKYEVIELKIGDAKELNSINDIFDKVELVFLDSVKNAFVSTATKSYVLDDCIYIYDRKIRNINKFDEDGKLLYNTKRLKGSAKNEYNLLSDYIVNSSTSAIEIFDPIRGRIMLLDSSGNYSANIKLPDDCKFDCKFNDIASGLYIFGGVDREFMIYNNRSGLIEKREMLSGGFPLQSVTSNDVQEFHNCGDSLFYIPNSDKYIYLVDTSRGTNIFSKIYTLNLLDNPLMPKDVEGMTLRQLSDFMRHGSFHDYSTFNRRFITDKYVVVSYILKKELYTYIYNRLTNNHICINSTFVTGDVLAPINKVCGDLLYSVVEAQYIPSLFPNYKFSDDVACRINNISDRDNMVLIKYTLDSDRI